MKHTWNKILSSLALFSLELLIVLILFIGSFIVFLTVSKEIFYEKEEQFDHKVYAFAERIQSPGLTAFMKGITFMASMNFISIVSILLFVFLLFIKKHHWYSLKLPVVCIGCIGLNLVLKSIFGRPRPLFPHLVEAFGLSFPSGHAMISFSFYGFLIYLSYLYIRKARIKIAVICLLLVLMHLIGFSRVYLGVHFASDVLAGFALGTIWLILSIVVLDRIEKISSQKIHP